MLKCCICGDVFDVGYEMPNGDCVCATHECCYEYCKCEGKRITQESEAKTMTNKPISFKEAYMTTIKKSGSAHNLTAQQPTGCVLKTLPVYHKEIDYPRPPSRNKTQKGNELRRAITGISIMGLGMFWLCLAEALENNNISIGQFLLSTLLLAVIGCSIGMIFVGAQTGFERR